MEKTMRAARLHAPHDLRVEEVPHPGSPGPYDILLRVRATGICGSDLHPYETGSIGDTVLGGPLVLGHEFSGSVEEVGAAVTGLAVGTRVAVDPAQPCRHCRYCEEGNPNLCPHQRFCGVYPDNGSLCEWMLVPARSCFPVPEVIDFAGAALLEPLGIALHATDLARIRVGSTVAVIGAGPVGLFLIQTALRAGASVVYVAETAPWRLAAAGRLGARPLPTGAEVDVAIEAAWAGEAARQAIDIVRPGGVVVLVGVPFEDELTFRHSAARRKGLSLLFSRRMKHTYPRAIRLVEMGQIDLLSLVSHRFPLAETPEAFALNAAYRDDVVKVIIDC